MHREIISACLPLVAVMAILSVLFVVIAKLSGGRWEIARLRRVHQCESGAVHSLAFVLTLPVLVMILLFIVQVSQLMIGLVVVNYAAYASARAASVWVPTMIADGYQLLGADADGDDQNELPPYFAPGIPYALTLESVNELQSRKMEKIWLAAVLACAPISPSAVTQDATAMAGSAGQTAAVIRQLYPNFDPAAETNSRIATRLDAKIAYSYRNTAVVFEFEDRNSSTRGSTVTYNPIDHPIVEYYESEVGWQDPITVTVYHDLVLLPGAGRMLSRIIQRADGGVDAVAPTIRPEAGVYKHRIRASATMTNEGIRSVRPYIYPDT